MSFLILKVLKMMKRLVELDGWMFSIVKENKNNFILEKDGQFYKKCKHSKKFSKLG